MRKKSGWLRRGNTGGPVVVAVLGAVLWANPLVAQEVPPGGVAEKSSSGREHVVRKGDTLWDLANYYLNNPFLWGLIYEANQGVVRNPHLIYPNDRLLIPDGSVIGRRESSFGLTDGLPLVGAAPDRTLFYRGLASAASSESESGVPTFEEGEAVAVASVQPGEYLAAPWLAQRSSLGVLGSIVRIRGQGSDRDKISQSVHPNDRIFIRYRGRSRPEVGDSVLLVREGRRVGDWGRAYEPGGIGVVEEVSKDFALVVVGRQFGRLSPGDLVIPLSPVPEIRGRAVPVEDGVRARIVGFLEEQPVYDTSDLAFVDLGEGDGVAIGDEFEVYQPERTSGWFGGTLHPEEPIAVVRVVRVDERTSTVRLIKLTRGALEVGLPVRLVGKMP